MSSGRSITLSLYVHFQLKKMDIVCSVDSAGPAMTQHLSCAAWLPNAQSSNVDDQIHLPAK